MKKTILIEKSRVLTRMAYLQEGELIATYIDSPFEPELQNKILVGQVDQIVKNLKAVFVDYGAEKKGLLHFAQIPEEYRAKLKQGLRLPIQVTRLNKGDKGNKLTAKVSMQGRYMVCLPFEPGISISKKIKQSALREKLKEQIRQSCKREYGFIIRTEAMTCSIEDFEKELKDLIQKADQFMKSKDYLSKGSILYEELPTSLSWIFDHMTMQDEITLICDDADYSEKLKEVCHQYGYTDKKLDLQVLTEKSNLFFVYGIQKQWDKLFERKIWLKNGGNIVIDCTEAMTVIDVNSAKAILSKNARQAILELNQLAIQEGLLQVLRRNLSGIILMDLVEMTEAEDREAAYHYAKKILETYGEKRTLVYPLTELGILQCTRSKKQLSVGQKLLEGCNVCGAREGRYNMLYEAFLLEQKLKNLHEQTMQRQLYIHCHERLYDFLIENDILKQLEKTYDMTLFLEKSKELQGKAFLCQF
ncbi:hypothetical protein CS063_05445 [Sporanaerobium hydrogeniformans]|uniref:Uncharacterized protein n=1 Tax=Sporanaerobium hydrogeniformans TaxID=3072179 RepID=A0AC61DGH7_9FIRM|nr:ribonuclease E/G [Sporanaerobium hydrogeniformans]PHV71492.1 hypothetical protein CS063_05445 [Sporanaerobium hydrogeniformans]